MRRWLSVEIGARPLTVLVTRSVARPVSGAPLTSEGCSSCPRMNSKAAELPRALTDLVLLTFRVTYSNYLARRDPHPLEPANQGGTSRVGIGD